MGIIAAVIIALILAFQYSTPIPPSWIANVPLKPNSSTINPPPRGIPPDTRCDWFVICGKYVIVRDYTNSSSVIGGIGNITLLGADYKTGDYIELTEFGIARMSGERSKYGDPRYDGHLNNVCYPRTGKWHAERTLADENAKYFIHKVSLDLFADPCGFHFSLDCTVEVSPGQEGRQEKFRLACNDGSVWILCDQPEQCKNIKAIDEGQKPSQVVERPAPIAEDAYGQLVSIEEARSKATFTVLVPTKLPGDVTLQRVRLMPSNDRVTLFYSGGFTIYEEKITTVENFNATRAAEATMQAGPHVKRFSYAGAVGVGVDPQPKEAGKPDLGPAVVTFWRDSTSYFMQGPFTFVGLRDTAISMLQP